MKAAIADKRDALAVEVKAFTVAHSSPADFYRAGAFIGIEDFIFWIKSAITIDICKNTDW